MALSTHFLIVGLHAEEDCVRSETGQTALQIWPATQLFRLCIESIQGLYGLLKLLLVNL